MLRGKKRFLFVFVPLLLLLSACSSSNVDSAADEILLDDLLLTQFNEVQLAKEPMMPIMPDVRPDMLTAGYWIARTPDVDTVLMDAKAIRTFNAQVARKFRLAKISDYEDNVSGIKLKKTILYFQNQLMKYNLYVNGAPFTKANYTKLMKIVDTNKIEDNVTVRFGIVVRNVSQRVIPTNEVFVWGENGSAHFDRNQMSSLECATPVAVLWTSTNKKWLYVASPLTEGWVPADSIALCSRQDVARWEAPRRFAVIVRAKAPVYRNAAMTDYYGWLPMGNKLTLSKDGKLFLPMRSASGRLVDREVFIQPEYLHEGFVPYTPRNMLNMAFEMLNAPYGWGGMYGEQDCSSYLIKVFATAGISLPRNSAQQGNTGRTVFTKNTAVVPATDMAGFFGTPGSTLIQFPGHVMLYIGNEQGKLFVIHAMWAYVEEDLSPEPETILAEASDVNTEATTAAEAAIAGLDAAEKAPEVKKPRLIVRSPARVVVSSLDLSPASEDGVYYERIANIRNIYLNVPQPKEDANTDVATK